MKTVKDMYDYSSKNNFKLLSSFNADFWTEYNSNYTRYDKIFCRMFYSFYYFLQNKDTEISELFTDFQTEVYNHLLLNEKKYSELYRVYVLSDDSYSVVDNYSITENLTKNTTNNLGARTDSSSNTKGAETDVVTDTISGFNSTGFENDSKLTTNTGARSDSTNTTFGSQINTGNESYVLTRKGNIGVKTASGVIKEHIELWTPYEFYSMIFKEICSELLLL